MLKSAESPLFNFLSTIYIQDTTEDLCKGNVIIWMELRLLLK